VNLGWTDIIPESEADGSLLAIMLYRFRYSSFFLLRVVDPDPDWIRIRIGSGFSDFVDPDPYWESRSQIRIQGQEN
jgi:hypothetical protein